MKADQLAEVDRFVRGDYDVVLGLLERRLDAPARTSKVRRAVAEILRAERRPAAVHKALIRLADRGGVTAIVTTNFDLLLEAAAKQQGQRLQRYSLGSIPGPSLRGEFSGVFHIHGALPEDPALASDVVVTDQDFGEFYLRRRVVPDFIYDAARLYHLVLVGYTANDARMRYLLNAVAADGSRFSDLKNRFVFIGTPVQADPVNIEDWKGRGITPIPYRTAGDHIALRQLLEQWSQLSAINGKPATLEREVLRITRTDREAATEIDRDLFDHLVRRSNPKERARLAKLISGAKAEIDWFKSMLTISQEPSREGRS